MPQVAVPIGHTCKHFAFFQLVGAEENFLCKRLPVVVVCKILVAFNRHLTAFDVLQRIVVAKQANKVFKVGFAVVRHQQKFVAVAAYLCTCNVYNQSVYFKVCVVKRTAVTAGACAADFVVLHIHVLHGACAGVNKK